MRRPHDVLALSTRSIMHAFKDSLEHYFTANAIDAFLDRLFTVIQIDAFADTRAKELCVEFAIEERGSAAVLEALANELIFHMRDRKFYVDGMLAYAYSCIKGDGTVVLNRVLEFEMPEETAYRQLSFSDRWGRRTGV